MNSQITRAKYEPPKLEVQRLRDLPPALATSGCHGSTGSNSCSDSPTNRIKR